MMPEEWVRRPVAPVDPRGLGRLLCRIGLHRIVRRGTLSTDPAVPHMALRGCARGCGEYTVRYYQTCPRCQGMSQCLFCTNGTITVSEVHHKPQWRSEAA